ncbi:MAG TPA: hypothetical protein VMU07_00705 [Candidatus Paceibacterota bacterium]|nr:hypothetical protein [Candidatus Paceibacterota bacterium]
MARSSNHPHKPNARSGQSLLETIIALSILVVALFSILDLLARSFSLNRLATNQTIAAYLAAEGIEVTKNIIDNDVYSASGNNWGVCCSSGDYTVDFGSTALQPGNGGSTLYFDPVNGMYGYRSDLPAQDQSKLVQSNFSRIIHITVPTSTEIDVESIVTWSSGVFTNQTVTLEDHFYDWHP